MPASKRKPTRPRRELTPKGYVVFGSFGLILILIPVLIFRACSGRSKGSSAGIAVAVSAESPAAKGSPEVVLRSAETPAPVPEAKAAPAAAETASKAPAAVESDPEATLPPSWVPNYPAAQAQAGGVKQDAGDRISGTYLARTKDSPDKVTDYFDSTLQADGFETHVTTGSSDGSESAVVTATKESSKRKLRVMANDEKGYTNLVITYEGVK